jgi:Ethanolamine utilization protein EutJ (predicted chaperonin)
MKCLVINEITNVLPVIEVEDGRFNKANDEVNVSHTAIGCVLDTGEVVTLLLPRGNKPCKGTYLLADAIRDDDQK